MNFKLFKWDSAWFEQADALDHIAPDWEIELQMFATYPSSFVAMSMGCSGGVIFGHSTEACLKEPGKSIVKDMFNKRLRVFSNNTQGFLPDCSESPMYPYTCSLRDATRWAYDHGWVLPKPMLGLISRDIKKEKALSRKYPRSNPKWRKAYEYESEGLEALYALIEKNFFDAEGNPIYDIENLPAKKTLESDWLKNRTISEADTIITSGKRRGKAEK